MSCWGFSVSRSASSSSPADGVLLIDKRAGETSRAAAARAARWHGATKFGHAGTLDPFATGLLIVLMGRACRTQDWFTTLPKAYEATARFGAISTTGDPEGEITITGSGPPERLKLPTGRIRQVPPAYSAVHIDGRRAYRRARAGEDFELPEREVEVFEFTETGRDGDSVDLSILCGSGTYVRSLVADLGDAYTESLRRTAIGPFEVRDADPERVLPLADALCFLPAADLDADEAARAGHGRPVDAAARVTAPGWAAPGGPPGEILLRARGEAVAIAERGEDGLLKPVVGFRG